MIGIVQDFKCRSRTRLPHAEKQKTTRDEEEKENEAKFIHMRELYHDRRCNSPLAVPRNGGRSGVADTNVAVEAILLGGDGALLY